MTNPPDLIAWKYANALIADAEPSPPVKAFRLDFLMDAMKRQMGGLWVGGTITLTQENLAFSPNAMNVAAHAGDTARSLPLARVSEVTDRFGWVTRIVDVRTNDGDMLTFRCFGARGFADRIRRAVQSVRR